LFGIFENQRSEPKGWNETRWSWKTRKEQQGTAGTEGGRINETAWR